MKMEIKIKETKVIEEITNKEIEFPYYGWYDSKKDTIIKMKMVYASYNPDKQEHISVIEINNAFTTNPHITRKRISIGLNNIVDKDILYYLRDYSISATEEEFIKFKNETLTCFE